jgi:hypothetical protein
MPIRRLLKRGETSRAMAVPSVKGSIFKGVIDDLARVRETGLLSEEQIEAGLVTEDLAFLETEVNPASWYPMESYARITQLLGRIEGAGKDSYFVERGRASARRLIEAGLYQQLAFLPRWNDTTGRGAGDESALIADHASKLRMVISMASSIYNVGKWVVEPDPEHPGRLLIAVREASAYSEPMRLAIEGFLNECARAARKDLVRLYTSERPAPDLILLRMTLDIADLSKRV